MAANHDTPKPSVLWVGVDLDGMTWRDLRAFVNICRDVPDDVEVGHEVDPYGQDMRGLRECIPVKNGGTLDGA